MAQTEFFDIVVDPARYEEDLALVLDKIRSGIGVGADLRRLTPGLAADFAVAMEKTCREVMKGTKP